MTIESILSFTSKIFAHLFLIAGTLMMLSGFFGMLRNKNKDVTSKMHFLATGESFGFLLCIVGLLLNFHAPIAITIKLIIITLLFWFSNAVTAYNIGKTEYVLSSKNDKIS